MDDRLAVHERFRDWGWKRGKGDCVFGRQNWLRPTELKKVGRLRLSDDQERREKVVFLLLEVILNSARVLPCSLFAPRPE